MFKLHVTAFDPHKAHYAAARDHVPVAHRRAQLAGVSHMHQRVVEAAEDADLDPSPIGIFWTRGTPYVGIAPGDAGEQLGDVEYGTPEERPRPILRTAHLAAHREAQGLYHSVLRQELGF